MKRFRALCEPCIGALSGLEIWQNIHMPIAKGIVHLGHHTDQLRTLHTKMEINRIKRIVKIARRSNDARDLPSALWP